MSLHSLPMTKRVPLWEDGSWQPLPQLAGEVEADVCVVGLGGSGLACVNELLALGRSVVGVDAVDVGAGAAGRNGGFLLAGTAPFYHEAVERYGRERAREIYRLTLEEIDRIAGETSSVVRRTGSLRLATSLQEMEDCTRQQREMEADGLPVEPYRGPEGEGLLFPRDAAFDPLGRCRLLADAARQGGAALYGRSPVRSLAAREVRVERGFVHCRAVVVAVDGGLEQLLPELEGRVRTARLQMLATEPTSEVRIPRPVYARGGLDYWQQLPGGALAVGGFRDLGGAEEWTTSTETSEAVQDALEVLVREGLGVGARITHRWAGAVGFSRTGLPVYEEVRPGVWAIGAYSGTGNVIGALCGRSVARRLATGERDRAALLLESGGGNE